MWIVAGHGSSVSAAVAVGASRGEAVAGNGAAGSIEAKSLDAVGVVIMRGAVENTTPQHVDFAVKRSAAAAMCSSPPSNSSLRSARIIPPLDLYAYVLYLHSVSTISGSEIHASPVHVD